MRVEHHPCGFSVRDVLESSTPIVDILDVGARIEGAERYTPLIDAGAARITAVEPNETELENLRAARPYIDRFIARFLGDGGTATVYETCWPGCISIYEPDPAIIGAFTGISAEPPGNFGVLRTHTVETCRLDDVDPPVAPDYLKLDVQGAELAVLRNGQRSIAAASIIECEVEFLPIYKNQPLFGDVQLFLHEQGFVLHKLIDIGSRCFRPIDVGNNMVGVSQMLWADAVFVRNFVDLAKYQDEALLKAALVLHDVYMSYDLANLLLREHDRRVGSDWAVRYHARLKAAPELPRLLVNFKESP